MTPPPTYCWDCGEVPESVEEGREVESGFNCRRCFDRTTRAMEKFLRLPPGSVQRPRWKIYRSPGSLAERTR